MATRDLENYMIQHGLRKPDMKRRWTRGLGTLVSNNPSSGKGCQWIYIHWQAVETGLPPCRYTASKNYCPPATALTYEIIRDYIESCKARFSHVNLTLLVIPKNAPKQRLSRPLALERSIALRIYLLDARLPRFLASFLPSSIPALPAA